MTTDSMCMGHTKLKQNYTVKCSSFSGVVALGTTSALLARQPSVAPAPGNNGSSHQYITIWYLPVGASSRLLGPNKAPDQKLSEKRTQEVKPNNEPKITNHDPVITRVNLLTNNGNGKKPR
eukprot:15548655-Heterocapsa_arctica.AAC.1